MSELSITHTAAEGTLLEGDSRGDGTYEVMKDMQRLHGSWRWSRNIGWYVRGSRDKQPSRLLIDAAATALRAADYTVTIDIDYEHRSAEIAEADRIADLEVRAEILAGKAEIKHRKAAAADQAAARAYEALPPMGEPVKTDHYSAPRHMRALDKAHDTRRKSMEAREAAARADRAAAASEHAIAYRHDPGVIARRLERMEADQRADERCRDGYTRSLGFNSQLGQQMLEEHRPATGEYRIALLARIAQRADEIAFQRRLLEQILAESGTIVFDKSMVRKGDYVRIGAERWWPYPVARVNTKTVSLPTAHDWTRTLPYVDITAVRNGEGEEITFTDGRRSDGR